MLLFAVFVVSGLIASHEAISMTAVIRLVVMVLAGAIGGLLGVNRKSKVK
jgi:hypothetical protein